MQRAEPKFVDKAPPEVVAEARSQREQLAEQHVRLQAALALAAELA